MATATEKPNADNLQQENPNKTLDLTLPAAAKSDPDSSQEATTDALSTSLASLTEPASDAASTPDGFVKDGTESKGVVPTNDAPLSDIQKKMRRAERFGISVQLSEQEKRSSRAERFGTRSTLQASVASRSEELKRNARAERFGIPSTFTADNEANKKARLARFAPVPKIDPQEEEKRKARALRFSNPASSSLSQANGEGNIEPAKPAKRPEWQLASLIVGNFLVQQSSVSGPIYSARTWPQSKRSEEDSF